MISPSTTTRSDPLAGAQEEIALHALDEVVTLRHERMTLPHEQLLSRRFVLIPALELDFDLCAPDGSRLADALAALAPDEGVRWAGPPLTVAPMSSRTRKLRSRFGSREDH